MESVRDILTEIGYSVMDAGKTLRANPLYRDSGSKTVLCINKADGRWYDFKECVGGSLEDLVRLTLKLKTLDDAKKWLTDKVSNPDLLIRKDEKPEIESHKVFAHESLTRLSYDHSYWVKRGISEEILKEYEGGVAMTGKMSFRYVFPVFNSYNEIVGFSGRDLTNTQKSKWKHIGSKSKWVYPFKVHGKDIRETGSVILVESIGDMLALKEAGISNTLVTFGLDVSSAVIKALLKVDASKIVIAFNNDGIRGAGNRAAAKASDSLSNYFDSTQVEIKLPQKKDFGEMSRAEIGEWFHSETFFTL